MYDTVESTVQFCLQKPNVLNTTLLKNTYEVALVQGPWYRPLLNYYLYIKYLKLSLENVNLIITFNITFMLFCIVDTSMWSGTQKICSPAVFYATGTNISRSRDISSRR